MIGLDFDAMQYDERNRVALRRLRFMVERRTEQPSAAGDRFVRLAPIFVLEAGNGIRHLDPIAERDAQSLGVDGRIGPGEEEFEI